MFLYLLFFGLVWFVIYCIYHNLNNMSSIEELVSEAFDNFKKILSTSEIKEKYPKLHWGKNGLGDRFAHKKFNYTCILSSKKLRTYSENLFEEIPRDLLEIFYKEHTSTGIKETTSSAGIIGIFVHSKKVQFSAQRPIRKDIHKEITKHSCLNCDEKETVCDHKNDLYNDPRVLNTSTQLLDDFQPLCNRCNLKKRQICIEERQTQKLFSAKGLNKFKEYKYSFPWEKKAYDETDIHCKKDTYWYDPVEFHRLVHLYHRYKENVVDVLHKKKSFIKKNI